MRRIGVFALLVALASNALTSLASAEDTRRSGAAFMQPATKALQSDDTQNPAMLWVKDGQAIWAQRDGTDKKSCADCHGHIDRMRGVATRYPQYSDQAKRVINLGQQINQCRTTRQQAKAWPAEAAPLLGLEAAISMESRGQPLAPSSHTELSAAQRRGETLFKQRIGQVDLSCRDCHEALAGKRLGGNTMPQAHPTGYPIYRLEWQAVGSLQRRLRNCMTAVRSEPFAYGASELVDLEAYLAKRASGMTLEAPGVRP
jgi:L-cysteine S-thiosulfotransferase